MSYSCIISKQNAAVLLTKIQMWRMTMNELSIKDGLILVFGDTLTPIQKAISSNFKFTSRTQINLNFVSRQTFFETPLSKLF